MNFRYTPLLIGLLIGTTIGLVYGWVLHPVEMEHSTPDSLQEAYRTDIILMVAEIYASEVNVERARQRMAIFQFEAQEEEVSNALNFAKAHDFSNQDIELLTTFLTDLTTPEATPEVK